MDQEIDFWIDVRQLVSVLVSGRSKVHVSDCREVEVGTPVTINAHLLCREKHHGVVTARRLVDVIEHGGVSISLHEYLVRLV